MRNKMKKSIAISLCTAFTIALIGCGPTEEDVTASSADFTVEEDTIEAASEALSEYSNSSNTTITIDTSNTPSMDPADPTFYYNQKLVSIMGNKDRIIDALGTPDSEGELQLSDHHYSFDSGQITMQTVDIKDEETPLSITILERDVHTSMEIGVGTSKDDVVAKYGENYETFKSEYGIGYKYDYDDFYIKFTFDSDEIKEFSYINKEAEKVASQKPKQKED